MNMFIVIYLYPFYLFPHIINIRTTYLLACTVPVGWYLQLLSWSCFLFQLMILLTCYVTFKAHDGGVTAVELSRVIEGAPQLITIGADKTLAIWDTNSFKVFFQHIVHNGLSIFFILLEIMGTFAFLLPLIKYNFQEMRRIKPVPKFTCRSVASWCHPRAPNLDILTCVKDSHIWYAHYIFLVACLLVLRVFILQGSN